MRIKLREAMENAGVSAREIMDRCGFNNIQTVYNIMNGRTTRLTPETIKCLCNVLDTDANFLYGIDNDDTEMTITPHFEKIVMDGVPVGDYYTVSFHGHRFWRRTDESREQFAYRVKSEIKKLFGKNINIK